MSIKKIMHKDRHGAQVSIEFGEGGPAAQLVEQFLGGMGVPAMQDIPQEHPGNPKGTDTVPAWLTPGEFVMNAEATRMFEPQIEEMNNAGRAVQRQQGGSIPEYKSYGGSIPEYYNDGGMAGSWLNNNVLDALLMTESGGDFNAVSPAGARGGYQIMPATAANPGYGVTPISSEDVLDPMKSREFARQYIMGIAKANPNATQQEVLQMYNAGPNRVKGANVGNPLTQETLDYPGKIEAQMARMATVNGATVDDYYDIPLDSNIVPEPEEVTIESLRSPTSDGGVLTSLKSAQATADSTPEEEDAFDKILSSGKDVGQWIMDNKVDAALLGLTFVPGVGVVAMAARGLSLANKLNSARKGKVALDAITKSQNLINKPVLRAGPRGATLSSVPKLSQKASPLRQANAGAAGVGVIGTGLSAATDLLSDQKDRVDARSTDKMLAYNAGEREKLIAGLESGDLRPDYVKKALSDLDKQDAKYKKARDNVSIMDFNKTKEDIEFKAKRLIDAGFVDEGNALLEKIPPPPVSDGVAKLTPSQAKAGMVAPVEDRSMTTSEIDSEQDQADAAAATKAGVAQLQKDIADGNYTSGSVAKYNKTGNVDDLKDKGDPTVFSKVIDFFKEGFGTVIDKGALSEAATLYLGSRALGYDHEGSLNFVTKRYGKGIEDKLAIANKAVGTHTPESITKYKDTGNLNDLVLIKTLTYTNETEYWTDPKTGDEITLRVAKNEKGRKVLVDPDDNPVDTKNFLKASEYKSRDEYNQKKIKSIMESKLRKFELDNDMAKGEGEAIISIPAVAQAMSMYSIENGFNTAKVNELSDYVFKSILENRSDPKNKDLSDSDLTDLALSEGVARQMEGNMYLKTNGKRVNSTTTGEVLDSMKTLPEDPVERGQMLKTMYQFGYMSRTPDEIDKYVRDAGNVTSGFLEYLKQKGYITDRDNWVPAWRSLNGQ